MDGIADLTTYCLLKIQYSSDGGTWYPEACISVRLQHRLHSPYEKSIIERPIEYLKDRTEAFDDYYPCMRDGVCNIRHVYKCLIFIFMHNSIIKSSIKFDDLRRWKYP
jgi:putative transposase